MRTVITLETKRTGYSIKQVVDRTMTVGELISVLMDFDEDSPIVFSNDGGYTFGEIDGYGFDEIETEDDDF